MRIPACVTLQHRSQPLLRDLQRRSHGMQSSNSYAIDPCLIACTAHQLSCTPRGTPFKSWWFDFFENEFGPDTPEDPLRHPDVAVQAEESTRKGGKQTSRAQAMASFESDAAEVRRSLRTASRGMMFYLVCRCTHFTLQRFSCRRCDGRRLNHAQSRRQRLVGRFDDDRTPWRVVPSPGG